MEKNWIDRLNCHEYIQYENAHKKGKHLNCACCIYKINGKSCPLLSNADNKIKK